MIFEAVEIDKLVYNDSYIGNYDNCVKWWKKNKYIYVMLEDIKTKKIIGYINAMPINNTLYEIIKKGEIIDVTINDENMTLSKILCKWKQDSVVSLFLSLNSV